MAAGPSPSGGSRGPLSRRARGAPDPRSSRPRIRPPTRSPAARRRERRPARPAARAAAVREPGPPRSVGRTGASLPSRARRRSRISSRRRASSCAQVADSVATWSVPSRPIRRGHARRATVSPTTPGHAAVTAASGIAVPASRPRELAFDRVADALHHRTSPGVTARDCSGSLGKRRCRGCRDDGLSAQGEHVDERAASAVVELREHVVEQHERRPSDPVAQRVEPRRARGRALRCAARPGSRTRADRDRRQRSSGRADAARRPSCPARGRSRAEHRGLGASAGRPRRQERLPRARARPAISAKRRREQTGRLDRASTSSAPSAITRSDQGASAARVDWPTRTRRSAGVPLPHGARVVVPERRPGRKQAAECAIEVGAPGGGCPLHDRETVRREDERRELVPQPLGRSEVLPVQRDAARLTACENHVRLERSLAERALQRDSPGRGAEADHLCVAAGTRREALGADVKSLEQIRLPRAVRAVQEHHSRRQLELERGVRAEVAERDLADDQPARRIGMIRYQKLSSDAAMRPGRRRLMSLS